MGCYCHNQKYKCAFCREAERKRTIPPVKTPPTLEEALKVVHDEGRLRTSRSLASLHQSIRDLEALQVIREATGHDTAGLTEAIDFVRKAMNRV